MTSYDRRVLDVRTRLIHASTLGKLGHYDYQDELACERTIRQEDLFRREPTEMVTCLGCIVAGI